MNLVTVKKGQTTREQMCEWVRFIWRVNEIESGLIGRPTVLSDRAEVYSEVEITFSGPVDSPEGFATFTPLTERAARALALAHAEWVL